jgi:two-component system chemotaxis sensor kinase CheA
VDELIGKQEVVIKGLGEMLKNTPGIAGGAILGNGQVGLILDLDAIYGQQSDV